MIKRSLLLVTFVFAVLLQTVKADEGMWLLSLIGKNYEQMKAEGFKLTPEDIYSVNHSSLKDAVGALGNAEYGKFGFFCSSEIISPKGLVLTNHHCGYEAIQSKSTVDHDYLKDGFWAYKMEDEIPIEGMTISYLVRMEDVTSKVLANVKEDMTESERDAEIQKVSQKLVKEATKGTDYIAHVKKMFDGNQYFLFVYITYKDIRLVGAPPSSIGKFGGDTDNWMWPRHTGDFSMFRIYTAPDGKPATYSKDNVPLKPKHYFPISLKGVKKNDFAMIMGYPGSTERYLTSFGVKQALEVTNPATIAIRDKKLSIMRKYMNADHAIKIKYAAKYAQTSNYWKYFIGQNKGIKRLHVIEKKQELEKKLMEWASQNPDRKKKYGWVLDTIASFYEKNKEKDLARTYLYEALFQGAEIMMFPLKFYQFDKLLANKELNKAIIDEQTKKLKEEVEKFYKDYDVNVDKDIFVALGEMYLKTLPDQYQPKVFKTIKKKYKGNFRKYADKVLYKKSMFIDKAKVLAFLENPDSKKLEKDPAFQIAEDIIKLYFGFGGQKPDIFRKARRLFVDGLMKMQKDKLFYPDANSTIRLTYGTVQDYYPRDAVHYNYFTTLKGIMEKEDPNNPEFEVPAKLKELYQKKDYGQYADADGTMHVCFLTTNDITGGNSGSPVLNGKGELIGTAFDGNWEAMSGDIAFEPELQRTIVADIRYILFVIDKFAGAKNLINEMTLVKE